MTMLIFDTETTGLIKNRTLNLELQPEVIEFYGVDGNKVVDVLIKPKAKLDPVITKITGLTDESLDDKPPFADVADEIFSFVESADCVVAHNASFDKEMLDIEAQRLDYQIKWPEIKCTIEATVHLRGYRLNLQELHKYLFDEGFEAAHRAKNDVMALQRCVEELTKRELL